MTWDVIAARLAGRQVRLAQAGRWVDNRVSRCWWRCLDFSRYNSAMTVAGSGWNLLAVFFGGMRQVGWPGQFNLDFMQMLTLSAIWVAWRHCFSPAGLVFAGLAFFGGSLFLSAYLLVISLGRRSGSGGRRSGGIIPTALEVDP